jgi:predicted ester cyclase
MGFDVNGLLELWSAPLSEDAEKAFRMFYTDPVTINGTPMTVAALVTRARAMNAVFADADREILDLVENGDKIAVAFRMTGRQVGALPTTLGDLPATGGSLNIRVIDILTLTDGLISNVWMVADELGALVSVDAVTFK